MMVYEFTLWVDPGERDLLDWSNRLYEAGGDDTHPGIFAGSPYITFTREAESLEAAIRSAHETATIADIRVLRCEINEEQFAAIGKVR